MKEFWFPVVECPSSYEVSNFGRVRSKDRIDSRGRQRKGKLLSQCVSNGYSFVLLSINGKPYNRRVHRLVAEAFLPKPAADFEVNHIDGNKLNNNADNLEWCSHYDNIQHIYETGLRLSKNN